MNPLVSVIVPNYNHAAFLDRRMESIFAQTYTDFEIILLDDHSSDISVSILERFRGHAKVTHIVYNEKNSGSTFLQWEKGISLASGKYIWIAESDDFCETDFLAIAVNRLEGGADLFMGLPLVVDADGTLAGETNPWLDERFPERWKQELSVDAAREVREMLFVKNTIPNASAVVFRKTEKLPGYFRTISGMRFCGDWLFWMLYLLDAKTFSFSPSARTFFRRHPSVTRLQNAYGERNLEVARILKFILAHPLSAGERKFIERYFFRHHFHVYERKNIRANFRLALVQVRISARFLFSWIAYYSAFSDRG